MVIDWFDCLYSRARGNNPLVLRLRGYSLARYLIRLFANSVLPAYFRVTSANPRYRIGKVCLDSRSTGVIVSLTTFPGRIDTVWLAVESLLRQEVPPDAVILWLSKDQFPSLECLPRSLLDLTRRGLRIELREGDLRSHKKYYFVRREYPNATLVLADDDIFYPTTMIRDLLNISKESKGSVVCRFAKIVGWNSDGALQPYLEWGKVNDATLRSDIFFGSGGGVLIPPAAIHNDAINERAIIEACPLADDIWLNAMCRLISPMMVSTSVPFSLLPVVSSDRSDLSSVNNGEFMNDRQLLQVRSYCVATHGIDPFSPVA